MLFERWRQEGLLKRYKETNTLILHTDREAAGHTDHLTSHNFYCRGALSHV